MMTEEEFEREVHFYQQALLDVVASVNYEGDWDTAISTLSTRFKVLAQEDRTHARQLALRLLEDERREVRLGFIKLLSSSKIRDDAFAMVLMAAAFKYKDLREEALSALYPVRTRRVLPQLLLFADKGYSSALYMIRRMLQNPEEIERGIEIARKYVAADDYELREAALFLLQGYSTMEREAEGVLRAIRKYKDELFISALREAPPEMVLEPLKALRSTSEEKYVQYWDLTSTIDVLEQKKREMDEKEREE